MFERNDVVCTQGKICPEMFIVDEGLLFATTTYFDPTDYSRTPKRSDRSLSRGNTTNMLALVKVWNHSLETVVAAVSSDCYGINCDEFCSHFESNQAIFEQMQKMATDRFEMVPDPHAPTALGRPTRRITDKEVEIKEHKRGNTKQKFSTDVYDHAAVDPSLVILSEPRGGSMTPPRGGGRGSPSAGGRSCFFSSRLAIRF